jgi:hypothetical protein
VEQDSEDEDDSEETESDEDEDCECDGAQNLCIWAHMAHDNPGCEVTRGRPALQEQRSKHDLRLVRSRVARTYRSQNPVRAGRPVMQKTNHKWIKARQIVSKTRLRRSQKVLEDATHEQPRSMRCQRRNSC